MSGVTRRAPGPRPAWCAVSVFGKVLDDRLRLDRLGRCRPARARRDAFAANLRAWRLLDIVLLPSIADRLECREQRIADQADAATVLFADLVGVTGLIESVDAAAHRHAR